MVLRCFLDVVGPENLPAETGVLVDWNMLLFALIAIVMFLKYI